MKFSEIDLHPSIKKNLERIHFVDCTPVQATAIPHVLAGRDIAGLAQTGTGKTAAFLVPLIDRVLRSQEGRPAEGEDSTSLAALTSEDHEKVLSSRYFTNWRRRHFILILVPTRELAEQVFENSKKLLEGTGLRSVAVYGGTTYENQKLAFQEGVEFVIATPGRLLDLFKEHIVDLRQVRAVVFDEADRMFDMGFKDDMKFILRRLPRERQFLVFSATLNFDVLNVAYEFGAFPVEINVSKDQPKAENVSDELLHLGQSDKPRYLLSLLKKHNPGQAIIFSNFKFSVEKITRFLNDNGVPAVGISSLLTQVQRQRVMGQFKAKNDQNILVATDLAARGLDILGVDMVINYELPDDPENYVHRIGRTGRALQKGTAFSLVCDRDVDALTRIEDYLGHKIKLSWLEDSEILQDMKPFPTESKKANLNSSVSSYRGGGLRSSSSSSSSFSGHKKGHGQGRFQQGHRENQGSHHHRHSSRELRNLSGKGEHRKSSTKKEGRDRQGSNNLNKSNNFKPNLDNRTPHRLSGRAEGRGGSQKVAHPPGRVFSSSASRIGQRSPGRGITKPTSVGWGKVGGFLKKLFGKK